MGCLGGPRGWVREGDVPPPARSVKAVPKSCHLHEFLLNFSNFFFGGGGGGGKEPLGRGGGKHTLLGSMQINPCIVLHIKIPFLYTRT